MGTAATITRSPGSRTLDAHLRAIALRAVQRQHLGNATAADAVTATIRALGSELGDGPLDRIARRRAAAYFSAAARSIALRAARAEDGEYRMLLRLAALTGYLREAGYREADLAAEVRTTYGPEGLALAKRVGLVPHDSCAA